MAHAKAHRLLQVHRLRGAGLFFVCLFRRCLGILRDPLVFDLLGNHRLCNAVFFIVMPLA